MFKLPLHPSARADCHEIADFAEFLAWKGQSVSARELVAYLGRTDDNLNNQGCEDDEVTTTDEMDEVMNELDTRKRACGSGYPFVLESAGTVLRHLPDDPDPRSHVYRYLLLATRLDMKNNRRHAKIDGGHLLEELSAHILQCYLGFKRARSFVFGTSAPGGFAHKVNDLCKHLGEGVRFRNRNAARPKQKDDKLDTVTWVPFSDRACCQLIVFNQCKTGSTWESQKSQLQPDAFVSKWMHDRPAFTPIRAFCIAEAADRGRWRTHAIDAGLLFDRCRLVDFCEDPPEALLNKVKTWTQAVIGVSDLSKRTMRSGSRSTAKTKPKRTLAGRKEKKKPAVL